jgi:hypothetical protein
MKYWLDLFDPRAESRERSAVTSPCANPVPWTGAVSREPLAVSLLPRAFGMNGRDA